MLIDFDYCRKHGMGHYPIHLTTNNLIDWACGVEGNKLMEKEHDDYQLKCLSFLVASEAEA